MLFDVYSSNTLTLSNEWNLIEVVQMQLYDPDYPPEPRS